ncbi:MAG: hypothetical protein ACI4XJ_04420 [Eubacteriales bacterium]
MNHTYSIIEIHTNSKADPSPVILHDSYTSEPVLQDGNDIDFSLGSGIILRPHSEPNNTDRYLQNGMEELCLRNVTIISVRNGETFPCVGEQFTLLHHKYRTDTGVFRLELINNRRQDELYFDFAYEAVVYRFSEFAGDLWVQQAKDNKHETFCRFLCQEYSFLCEYSLKPDA